MITDRDKGYEILHMTDESFLIKTTAPYGRHDDGNEPVRPSQMIIGESGLDDLDEITKPSFYFKEVVFDVAAFGPLIAITPVDKSTGSISLTGLAGDAFLIIADYESFCDDYIRWLKSY